MKKYTRHYLLLVLILAALLLTSCNAKAPEGASNPTGNNPVQVANNAAVNNPAANIEGVEADEFAMGTIISQKVYGPNGQAAIDQAIDRIRDLEKLLTFNASEGDIYNLNNSAGNKGVKLDPITIKVIQKAQQVAELSNGAFDITIGPLVKRWGIGAEKVKVPSKTELDNLLALTNYKDLEIDGSTARLKKPGQLVDLGGIAKGYAGDEVVQIYKENGIKSAFVNLGGNVITLGSKPDGSPWTVGVSHPRVEEKAAGNQILGAIKVRDKAVVTAGDGQRYTIQDGIRYHHILDPKTGYPAQSGIMSVTLVMDSSFDADALDTAVFILGLEKGLELVKKIGGIEAIFITTDKKIVLTDGLKGNFTLFEGNSDYEVMGV